MNRELLRQYIAEYEKEFSNIHDKEIYKWRAVKQFQKYWRPNADNFVEMLELSLSETHNLMDSGNYFPMRMILKITKERPQPVRDLFLILFDEELDLQERIVTFQEKVAELSQGLFPGKNDYQDDRAVMVYLSLRFPETYFFYKFTMFKEFCEKVDTGFSPTIGQKTKVIQYLEMCQIIREEIRLNNNLLKLHKERINETEYFDVESNLLTQDFIYAVSTYLTLDRDNTPTLPVKLNLQEGSFEINQKQYVFKSRYMDHVAKQKRHKRIGDLGEQIVLQHEQEHCSSNFVNKIEHSSKIQGDGLGFDILSFDERGEPKYIEIKATTGGRERPFFITGVELARSKQEGDKYFLYRLYNLDEKNMTADYFIIQGDLSNYCVNPIEFEVILEQE